MLVLFLDRTVVFVDRKEGQKKCKKQKIKINKCVDVKAFESLNI